MSPQHQVPVQTRQLATFHIADRFYGIDVMRVQEVTQAPRLTVMHLAPSFVRGLINLRGQIATAIGMRELFGNPPDETAEPMTIVCQHEHSLLSLIVDKVGDVIEVDVENLEEVPATVEEPMRKFIDGVCVLNGQLLSVVGIERIAKILNGKEASV